VELAELLAAMDRAAANLEKLEQIWARAKTFIPDGPAAGSDAEYDDLCRGWLDLLRGLPPIDGWTITEALPDIDEMGRAFMDYLDIGEPAFQLYEEAARPEKELAEYRYRLNRARRRAARERLQLLTTVIDTTLAELIEGVPRDSTEPISGDGADNVRSALSEIERLLGDATERRGRWTELRRHMHFSQGQDWHDVAEHDWPSVRVDIEASQIADTDPLPVPDFDLGEAATGELLGEATIALPWSRLDDEAFERLLYDLTRSFDDHDNVQWLMQTRAPDRGRDLSLDRVVRDATGGVRTERVIVQAKHWLTRSVAATDIGNTVTAIKAWEPPVVRTLIIATSGRFTADGVAWAEQHNNGATSPLIELWPDSKLETLLAQKPYLAAAHGLR
jgi:hypothetical protein